MVMAPGAANRQTEPDRSDHRRPINELRDAILLQIGPPFTIAERLSQESRPQHSIKFPLWRLIRLGILFP